MNLMKYSTVIVLLFCCSCAVKKKLSFVQGDNVIVISEKSNNQIDLNKAPFSILYFSKNYRDKASKYYAAQIAVLDNENDIALVKPGMEKSNIPFFEPGTGMAPGYNEKYDTMYVSNNAHHYLTYEDDRVYLVSRKGEYAQLEWKIKAIHHNKKDYNMKDIPTKTLFFVVLVNRNLNKKVEKKELKIVKVNFR